MSIKNKKTTTAKSQAASALGRLGGKATVKKLGKKHMQAIGRKGAEARRKARNK